MEALVVGTSVVLGWPMPHLLARAGFKVDVIALSAVFRRSKFVSQVHVVGPGKSVADFAAELIGGRPKPYDLVVLTDDHTLTEFVELERRSEALTNLLPLTPGADRCHLHSKIGLSQILSACGIRTPPSGVAHSYGEAIQIADRLGYPVLVKRDASSGGDGVHECHAADAIRALRPLFARPVLIQKVIVGKERRISATFFEGQLVHFDFADVARTVARFGPSVLRTYYPSAMVDAGVFDELSALGRALGAHGFSSIGCIEADDGSGRYYFEADMRPNAWADYASYFGEDPAKRIRSWFSNRIPLARENAVAGSPVGNAVTIPHFMRLSLFELAINRYRVWRYIPWADARLVRSLVLAKISTRILRSGKRLAPRSTRQWLKRVMYAAGLFLN